VAKNEQQYKRREKLDLSMMPPLEETYQEYMTGVHSSRIANKRFDKKALPVCCAVLVSILLEFSERDYNVGVSWLLSTAASKKWQLTEVRVLF